jgi:hypothetical protein
MVTEKMDLTKHRKIKALVPAFIVLAGVIVAVQIANIVKKDANSSLEMETYVGEYRFESISGKINQRVGNRIRIRNLGGQLHIITESDSTTYRLFRDDEDYFHLEKPGNRVKFVRDAGGKVIGLVSLPYKSGLQFTIRKMEKGGTVSREPLLSGWETPGVQP